MKKKNIFKNLLKVVVFVLIFAILYTTAIPVLSSGSDRMSYNSVKGFYEEQKESLDAVYIGSSNVLAFWNPLFAWKEYGLAISSFATNSQPLAGAEYLIKEARKTQPDALMVVNINTLGEDTTIPRLHKVFSFAPFSINKFESVNRICDWYGFDNEAKQEFYFPIIRFHSRWNSLVPEDFAIKSNGFKGTLVYGKYFRDSVDVSKKYKISDELTPLPDLHKNSITSLLDYCDAENVEILFVTVPQAKDVNTIGKYNAINKMIEDRGYPVLNLMEKTDEIGISIEKDYYNEDHINIHGSLKYTYYMSEYFIDNYGFKDKRGEEAYKSWDEGLNNYMLKADSSIMDFQMNSAYDYDSLSEPEELTAVAQPGEILLSWNKVEGAEGYAIYGRRGTGGEWKKVTETSKEELSIKNSDEGAVYFYRVVPFKDSKGKKAYGDFSYSGVFVVAKGN